MMENENLCFSHVEKCAIPVSYTHLAVISNGKNSLPIFDDLCDRKINCVSLRSFQSIYKKVTEDGKKGIVEMCIRERYYCCGLWTGIPRGRYAWN